MTTPLDPHLFIIFGGTGDLAARKLLPALHELITVGDAVSRVLAVGRSPLDDIGYREWASAGLTDEDISRVRGLNAARLLKLE